MHLLQMNFKWKNSLSSLLIFLLLILQIFDNFIHPLMFLLLLTLTLPLIFSHSSSTSLYPFLSLCSSVSPLCRWQQDS